MLSICGATMRCFMQQKIKVNSMETKMQQLSHSIQQHGASMERLELCGLLEALRIEKRDLMLQLATALDSAICKVLTDQVNKIKESI